MNRITSATLILAVTFALLAASGVAARTIKVNRSLTTGNDSGGPLWQDAYRGPQALTTALGQAQALDHVWVASGTYKLASQGASFDLVSLVKVYGGFPTTGEPTFEDRNPDPETNGTVLDGDINGDDSGFSSYTDNCFVVVSAASIGSLDARQTVLDGFTIRGAQQNGVFNDASLLTYENLLITENQWATNTPDYITGAGMLCDNNSDVVVTNTIFRNNRLVGPVGDWGGGAAVAAQNGSDMTMTDCLSDRRQPQ